MSGGPRAGIASGHCPTGVGGPLSISNAPQVVANHKATRISVPIFPICGMSPASAASNASAAMTANRAKRPSAANPCDIALPAASLPLRSERTATTGIVSRSARNARPTPRAAAPPDVDSFLGDWRPDYWISDRYGGQMGWAKREHQVCLARRGAPLRRLRKRRTRSADMPVETAPLGVTFREFDGSRSQDRALQRQKSKL